MMKNKVLKFIYVFLIVLGVFGILFLFIHPLKGEVGEALFDTEEEVYLKEFNSRITQIVKVDDNTFNLTFFLDGGYTYDNLDVKFSDMDGNIIYHRVFGTYRADTIIIGFDPIKSGTYKLEIRDLDNDPISLFSTKASDEAYIENSQDMTLKIAVLHLETNYFYYWYPIFIFAFLFTIYPFVWKGDGHEK